MNLRKQTIDSLRTILEKDYGVSVNETDTNSLGVSILRLSNLAITALARTTPKHDSPILKNN